MSIAPVIEKHRELLKSEDYSFLKETGINHIQELAHEIWTDYNVHDPGITTLEILCYAMTDLAYRTNYSLKDILAEQTVGSNGDIHNFFRAREILTCNPVTMNDFRKFMIDIEGVKNAWMEIPEIIEPHVYIDCRNSTLSLEPGKKKEPVHLTGLYNVILELDANPDFGDLNLYTFSLEILDADTSFVVRVVLPSWQIFFNQKIEPEEISFGTLTSIANSQKYSGKVQVKSEDDEMSEFPFIVISRGKKTAANQQLIEAELSDQSGLAALYLGKVKKALAVAEVAFRTLQQHRNLCEDFYEFKALEIEEVAVCTDIQVTPEADIEEVLAEVYYQIEHFLAPQVKFYSVQELMDKGKTTDEIFSGPILNHGFIDEEELEASKFTDILHVSDIIQIIMDIPGVVAAKKILLSNFYKGEPLTTGEEWCLPIGQSFRITDDALQKLDTEGVPEAVLNDLANIKNQVFVSKDDFLRALKQTKKEQQADDYKHFIIKHSVVNEKRATRLNIDKSKIVFYKGLIPYSADENEMQDKLNELHGLDRHRKLGKEEYDLEVPKGKHRAVHWYYSIQHDYPLVYGIGKEGLPRSATRLRKAQAKQLKAYLLFYDQLLANYFAQLAHVKDLFSMSPEIKKTYFSQPLYEIPDVTKPDVPNIQNLIGAFVEKLDLKDKDIDDFAVEENNAYDTEWNNFIDTQKNEFLQGLNERESMLESQAIYEDRKNRFLDHLMARFCEQFTDYVLLMYSLDRKRAPAELIEDKFAFLNDYPQISHDRGKAFNYRNPKAVWDTENVSGLQKRGARLLGIDSFMRRFLSPVEVYREKDIDAVDEFRFRLLNKAGKILLSSSTKYLDMSALKKEVKAVFKFGRARNRYKVDTTGEGKFFFNLLNDQDEVIARRIDDFETQVEAEQEIDEVVAFLNQAAEDEGFHLIEHILLRPIIGKECVKQELRELLTQPETSDVNCDCLLNVCVPEDCNTCSGFVDPYSFRATVVVPYWPERFQNMDFRQFFETTIRMEAPAHVHVKICWVDQVAMREFEEKYLAWLKQISKPKPVQKALTKAQNQLIKVLESLRSVYPEVTLHDCEEGTEERPVVLNHSIIGTTSREENGNV